MQDESRTKEQLVEELKRLRLRVAELEALETDLKQAAESLQESAGRLADAERLAHLGSWVWNIQSGQVEWSEGVYRIFGLDPEDFYPEIDSVMAGFHPDDRSVFEEVMAHATASRERYSFEARILLPDGSTRFVISTSEGQYDDSGGLAHISGIVQDITDRKEAEEELTKYRQHLEDLVGERTADLRSLVSAMAGREVRMADLKDVIRKLRAQLEEAGLTPVADDPLLGNFREDERR
jgi:PAS domain S-box-containing protein